jgi:hypothetical protein
MDSRAAWSAAGGAVIVVSGTNAGAWAVASAPADSALPLWPAYAFGGIAICGLYAAIAPLVRIWPFSALRSAGEVLDEHIRLGRAVRERIRHEQVSDTEATIDYVRWFMRTADALDDYVPSVADQFTFARLSEEENVLGPQGRLVALVNMGLAVLAEARRDV